MELEHEFELIKELLILGISIDKATQYEKDAEVVDLPEFMRPISERKITRASNYLAMLKEYNKVNETLLTLL